MTPNLADRFAHPPPRRTRRHTITLLGALALSPLRALPQSTRPRAAPMKIRIVVGDQSIPVTLDDNASARDFVSLLPLSLTLEDHADTEKIATLPRKLTTDGTPAGSTPVTGDFSYYAPWGNLAIYLKPFHHSPGLVRLGRIDGRLELLNARGKFAVRFEVRPA